MRKIRKNKIIFINTETEETSIKEPGVINIGYIICDLGLNEIKREKLFLNINEKEEKNKNLILKDFENAYIVSHNFGFDRNTLRYNDIKIGNNTEWIDTKTIGYNLFLEKNLITLKMHLDYHYSFEYINRNDELYDVMLLKSVFGHMIGKYNFQNKIHIFGKLFAEYESHNKLDSLTKIKILDSMVEDTEEKYNRDNLIMKAKDIEASNLEVHDDKIDFSSITKVHKL